MKGDFFPSNGSDDSFRSNRSEDFTQFYARKIDSRKKESAEASVLYISVYRTSIGTELIDHGIVIPQMHRLKWINRGNGSFRWRIEVSSDEF